MTAPNPLQVAVEHHLAGRLAEAEKIYRRILEVYPEQPDALHLLGVLAFQVGQAAPALDLIRRALQAKPDFPEACNNLGNVLKGTGALDQAEAAYRQAIALKPDYAEAHCNLALALKGQDRLEDAEASLRHALALHPRYVEALNSLGNVLHDLDRLEEAEAAYRQAIALKPGHAEAHYNLANTLRDAHRPAEAETAYRAAIAARPAYAEALNNLGLLLLLQGRPTEAEGLLREALAKSGDRAEGWSNLGMALHQQGRLSDAEAAFRRVLDLAADDVDARVNLGAALHGQGRVAEAEAAVEQAMARDPNSATAHSNLLFLYSYNCLLTPERLLEQHQAWARRHARPRASPLSYPQSRDPERRLRIGYLSPDFRQHSVAYFIEPVIAAHDRARVELFLYAELPNPDAISARFERLADHWRSVEMLEDDEVADLIAADGIDILVDLAGHTAHNRLPVLGLRPAPVQATYLGYFATTGIDAIDYWISDAVLHPADTRELTVETIYRLPRCWVCYRPPADAPAVAPPPAADAAVTFGSFNNLLKVGPRTVALWARVLKAAPQSRLIIKSKQLADPGQQTRIKDAFVSEGVARERIDLRAAAPSVADHLAMYGELDVVLDPLPLTGGTGTAEALWMGLPVVTLAGATMPQRMSASMLASIGRAEWIAGSEDEYVAIAKKLAQSPDARAQGRREQRARVAASPLADERGLAAALEDAYGEMWRRWCAQGSSTAPGQNGRA